MTTTALELIEGARLRHWSFTETSLGDGAAVRFLNHRLRTLLLRYKSALRSVANATVRSAAVVSGVLVGVDGDGVPYYLSTVEDGYAVHLDGTGVPYIDTSEAPIAYDPLGIRGGTPGWPLPTDAIALLSFSVDYQDGSSGEVDVVDEALRHQGPPGHNPAAYLSGNRLVPIRPAQPGGQDVWSSVTAARLSYLALPTVDALADPIALPAVLAEALVAALAEFFANQSKDCTQPERRDFAATARRTETELDQMALDVIGDLQVSSVIYEG
jgi:hypothetical protein